MAGELFKAIDIKDSLWLLSNIQEKLQRQVLVMNNLGDGILHVILLKKSRKGHYCNGDTNADTFWRQILKSAHISEHFQMQHPPHEYYSSPYDADDLVEQSLPRRQQQATQTSTNAYAQL